MLAGLKPRLFDELKDYGDKWIYELPKVVWGLHTQQSRAMGYSPFFLVYGSEAILPANLTWNTLPGSSSMTKARQTTLGDLKLTVLKKSNSMHSSSLLDTCKVCVVTTIRMCALTPFKSKI